MVFHSSHLKAGFASAIFISGCITFLVVNNVYNGNLDKLPVTYSYESIPTTILRPYHGKEITGTDPLPLCPVQPPGLVGPISGDKEIPEMEVLNKRYLPTGKGGYFAPSSCTSHNKTAIIVPYRNRENHLLVLLNNLIPLLIKQQSEFTIFVVEPVSSLVFNRALLMNVGFVEAMKMLNFTCFVFHDVDLIPGNDRNLYRCGEQPRHMAVANSKFKFRLPYGNYAGGVLAMSTSVYRTVNGHSNLYFGWGAEDDDMYTRLRSKRYNISRYPLDIGRYTALPHGRDKGNSLNPDIKRLSQTSRKRMHIDGLNSLKYTVVKMERRRLYTWILVDIEMAHYNYTLYTV